MGERAIRAIADALDRSPTPGVLVEIHEVDTQSPEGAADLDALAAAIREVVMALAPSDLPHRGKSSDGGLEVGWIARAPAHGESAGAIAG